MNAFVNSRFQSLNWKTVVGVFGVFMVFIGLMLLIPIPVSLYYDDQIWEYFLVSAVLSFVPGAGLYILFKPENEVQLKEGFLIVSLTWFILSLSGALPFYLSGVLPSLSDAFFETMSGLTTTGATIFGGTTDSGYTNPAIEDVPESLLFWRSFTHWIGGMGFVVLSIAILPLLGTGGMQLFSNESSLLTTDKITPRVQETAAYLWLIYFGLTLLHFFSLWIHPSMNWFDALNHAFSTMATGGFSTKNASVAAFDSAYIDIVITLFMFLAGVNFVLHFSLIKGDIKKVFQNRELRFYVICSVLFAVIISLGLKFQTGYDWADSFRYGFFQAITILTTTGYGTDDYLLWSPLPLLILAVLFFTGASTGSTSGGIKMIRWLIILKDILLEVKQRVHPKAILPLRVGNFVVSPLQVRNILAFLLAYILLFLAGALYLATLGFDLPSSFGASIACLGNIGPAFGVFGPVDNYAILPEQAKWVLSILMLVGRLELFTFLVLLAPTFWRD